MELAGFVKNNDHVNGNIGVLPDRSIFLKRRDLDGKSNFCL
jgi:hypothetical protein